MDRYRLVTTTKEYSVVAAFADKYRIKDENEDRKFCSSDTNFKGP